MLKKTLVVILFLSLMALSVFIFLHGDTIAFLQQWGYLGLIGICFIANATVFLPAPSIAITISMSTVLNPLLVGICAGIGTTLGEMVGYFAGRMGRELVPEEKLVKVSAKINQYGALAVFVFALLPLPLFDVAGTVAGVCKMPIAKFITACFLGKTLKMLTVAFIGQLVIPLIY